MADSQTTETRPAEQLTDKQRSFCREYMADGNGRQAAIRAGYAVRGSAVEASRLLTKANVQAELDRLRKEAEAAAIATHDEACRILTDICRLKEAKAAERIAAIAELARLRGYHKPERVTLKGGPARVIRFVAARPPDHEPHTLMDGPPPLAPAAELPASPPDQDTPQP